MASCLKLRDHNGDIACRVGGERCDRIHLPSLATVSKKDYRDMSLRDEKVPNVLTTELKARA